MLVLGSGCAAIHLIGTSRACRRKEIQKPQVITINGVQKVIETHDNDEASFESIQVIFVKKGLHHSNPDLLSSQLKLQVDVGASALFLRLLALLIVGSLTLEKSGFSPTLASMRNPW